MPLPISHRYRLLSGFTIFFLYHIAIISRLKNWSTVFQKTHKTLLRLWESTKNSLSILFSDIPLFAPKIQAIVFLIGN